jgi:hypothetical protein
MLSVSNKRNYCKQSKNDKEGERNNRSRFRNALSLIVINSKAILTDYTRWLTFSPRGINRISKISLKSIKDTSSGII